MTPRTGTNTERYDDWGTAPNNTWAIGEPGTIIQRHQ